MRYLLIAGVAMPLMAFSAHAQTSTTVPATPVTPPATVVTPGMHAPVGGAVITPATPDHRMDSKAGTMGSASGGLAGANSFTEEQARSRLKDAGFTDVTDLAKDKDGVWRGQAMKGSAEHKVGVDFKGNVVTN